MKIERRVDRKLQEWEKERIKRKEWEKGVEVDMVTYNEVEMKIWEDKWRAGIKEMKRGEQEERLKKKVKV